MRINKKTNFICLCVSANWLGYIHVIQSQVPSSNIFSFPVSFLLGNNTFILLLAAHARTAWYLCFVTELYP